MRVLASCTVCALVRQATGDIGPGIVIQSNPLLWPPSLARPAIFVRLFHLRGFVYSTVRHGTSGKDFLDALPGNADIARRLCGIALPARVQGALRRPAQQRQIRAADGFSGPRRFVPTG